MAETKSYFFCGIGGSGMLPLASIVRAQGAEVAGSDRSLDQGRLGDKFAFLERQGIRLFPQDGSGLTSADQTLVTSAAVEETIPDVQAARRLGARHLTRPQLLAQLFNAAALSVGVAGTSGKSTVTGMIGWVLHRVGLDPTVMNGAVMKNFVTDETPFASALAGRGGAFVSEVDESDGSIALYAPRIALLNNVSLDHKSMEELRDLFGGFLGRAGTAIVNADDKEARALGGKGAITFSLYDGSADLCAEDISEEPFAISLTVRAGEEAVPLRLQVPGRHNASNALAALAAVRAAGVPLAQAAEALGGFTGLRRRFDMVGTRNGVAVIDDFGHNPDKISATLKTLHGFPGRLLLFFQPHGYGPLKVMKNELISAFVDEMGEEDVLILRDPVYFGGTVERTVGSEDIVAGVQAAGRTAEHYPTREECGRRLAELAKPGDRIVIMGARDDTLSVFARELLESL
ncbi:MAG TPA: Mur ligase family protein [Allosphingosinicella sp.]|jgi:UDP-N-acetylmuramate--alanine ligase